MTDRGREDNTGANRANVALAELQIPFEERIINVDGPRPAEFLALNPRGLVPVLVYHGEVLVESAVVCQFLADLKPAAPLCPASTTVAGALRRARLAFFADAYWSYFHTRLFRLFEAPAPPDEERVIEAAVDGLAREVEPLLADAAPFFGGSADLTLAEVSQTNHATHRRARLLLSWYRVFPLPPPSGEPGVKRERERRGRGRERRGVYRMFYANKGGKSSAGVDGPLCDSRRHAVQTRGLPR